MESEIRTNAATASTWGPRYFDSFFSGAIPKASVAIGLESALLQSMIGQVRFGEGNMCSLLDLTT